VILEIEGKGIYKLADIEDLHLEAETDLPGFQIQDLDWAQSKVRVQDIST
jgi:hypothetical protein